MGNFNQVRIRENNKQKLLNTFENVDYCTAQDIIRKTGLTSVTVNSLLKDVLEEGWIIKSHYEKSTGGRPPMVYKFNENKHYILQLAVTKTHILITVINLRKEKVFKIKENVKVRSNQILRDSIAKIMKLEAINQLLKDLIAVTITISGVIDVDKATLLYSDPLNVTKFDFKKELAGYLTENTEVYVFKRVDGLLMNSIIQKAEKNKSAYIMMGDGLGLSVNEVIEGKTILHTGSELGHVVVYLGNERKKIGDLFKNDYLIDRYNFLNPKAKVTDCTTLKKDLEKGGGHNFTEELEELIALISANVINLIAPDRLIIGGNFTKYLSFENIYETSKEYILDPFKRDLSIEMERIDYEKLIKGTANYVISTHVFKMTK